MGTIGKLDKPIFYLLVIGVLAGSLVGCNANPDDLTFSGTVEANQVEVAALTGGQVLEVKVEEGQQVSAGDVVAVIDAGEAEIQVRKAEAMIAAIEAQLKDLKAGSRLEQLRQAEARVKAAEAAISGAERNLEFHQQNLARVQQLFTQSAVQQQQLDQAQAQVDAAQSQLDQARANYEAAKAQLKLLQAGATSNAIKALEANLRQAEAARDLAQLQVDRATVKAAVAGTVVSKNINSGEIVTPGTSLVTLSDLADLWVKVYIPEAKLGLIRLGDPVEIKIDTFPDRAFKGQVVWIAQEAEFTPKNVQTKEERVNIVFAVKVKVLDGVGQLKPGMPADVIFQAAE